MADEGRRQGDRYILTQEEISKFHSDGYVHLKVHPKFWASVANLFDPLTKILDVHRNYALHVSKPSLKIPFYGVEAVLGCPCIL